MKLAKYRTLVGVLIIAACVCAYTAQARMTTVVVGGGQGAAAPAAVHITDAFGSDTSADYIAWSGTRLAVSSGQAVGGQNYVTNWMYQSTNIDLVDMVVSLDAVSNGSAAVCCNITPNGGSTTAYCARLYINTYLILDSYVGTTATQIDYGTVTFADPGTITIDRNGSTLLVKYNGVTKVTYNSASLTGTYSGLMIENNNLPVDNFDAQAQ